MNSESKYACVKSELEQQPRRWLVTGVAGFIGSHLLEELLRLGQGVVGVDNFATGKAENLDQVRSLVGETAWSRFEFLEGDLQQSELCSRAVAGVDRILHQAALGSVPRSIRDPWCTHRANVDAFLQLVWAAKEAGVPRFVYASSSSVYGDHPELPKTESRLGRPLSPYAASKRIDEIYAQSFWHAYRQSSIGLRYFNVFGPRQDPNGPYAAVIPRWIGRVLSGQAPVIFGDGQQSRDFSPVANVVQANLLAAEAPESCSGQVYNIGLGGRWSLNELWASLRSALSRYEPTTARLEALHEAARPGDVPHSQADITKARDELGFLPIRGVEEGLECTLSWFLKESQVAAAPR